MSGPGDRHRRLRELFEGAAQQPAQRRGDWLREACDDESLVAEVLELLALSSGDEPTPQVRLPAGAEYLPGTAELIERIAQRRKGDPRYQPGAVVARGGMGVVLEVWDDELRRRLAMKRIPESAPGAPTSPATPRTVDRFVQEAQVTGQLDHPGIVPVHDLGLDADGRLFFTMKLVHGSTLKQVFDELARGEGGWTRERVIGLLLKACEALSFAHSKGVIHRDVKPTNVMVGRFGEVYVMDWGLARAVDQEDTHDLRVRTAAEVAPGAGAEPQRERPDQTPGSPLVTMDGDVIGTPAYMPPEQALGRVDEMGPHSDVYAFGAMLYQLLAGHPPYSEPGTKPGNLELLLRLQQGPPTALGRVAPAAPPELAAICEKAMARAPADRYGDMAELSDDLRAYVEGRVVRAHETGAWAEARKWVLRNRALAAALLAALLIGVSGLAAVSVVEARGRARAETEQGRAEEARGRAEESERRARAETAKVLRLSDAQRLAELLTESERLWPPYPEKIEGLRDWLGSARELAGNLDMHRASLAELRAEAGPWSGEQRERDRRTHPRHGELLTLEGELEALIESLEDGLEGEQREEAERRLGELEERLPALREEVTARRTWQLPTVEAQWQHDLLVELVAGLESLERELIAPDAVSPTHGWSVAGRLDFAVRLQEGFAEGGEHRRAWEQALPAIAEAYPGLELAPQIGLLPLGPNPQTGLWEFAHLMTGTPAERVEDGRLRLEEESGLVLVLLPGGTFRMGAQAQDPAGPNYDPQAQADESPVHEVELSPFFLSKFEMAQGPWERVAGSNPAQSQRSDLAPTLFHPVERITWEDAHRWLQRMGLSLPTEAQWEYGARGGTDTVWWTGSERDSLIGTVNLADQAAARGGAAWKAIADWPELDDGYIVHARGGTFPPNAFGLHEIHGNVWEWCLDGYDRRFYDASPRLDPLAPFEQAVDRVNRGGGHADTSERARSANRSNYPPTNSSPSVGVRPACAIRG